MIYTNPKIKRVGTLLPMTALVSRTVEPGTIAAGEKFVDWLSKSKQNAWQILPLHQCELQKGSSTKYVPSPYKGYGVGLDPKFLDSDAPLPTPKEFTKFVNDSSYWLLSYTLFCALRDYFGTDNWNEWPEGIRTREKDVIEIWQKKLSSEISAHTMTQVRLHLAYENLRKKSVANKIVLIGDMPFYLGMHGPLVWEYQHLFDIESNGKLQRVSGVLTGVKSHFGRQIWGHPLYKWQDHKLWSGLTKLFEIRLKYLSSLFNLIRFDHAKGFFFYGSIDINNHQRDKYLKGPGSKILDKLIRYSLKQKLNIYAEDTGDKLKELRDCLLKHKLPGVKIFRFGYNERRKKYSEHYLLTDDYPENTVAYTTTHDTETLVGYLKKLTTAELKSLMKKIHLKTTLSLKDFAEAIRKIVIQSPAKIVLIPLQDWLLTTDRINTPGTEKEISDPNWQYKMSVAIEDLPTDMY